MSRRFAIEATQLRKTFGDEVAVDGVDLQVPSGHIYGFLGPNGAGKTTTMRMLVGLTTPTAGTASIAGAAIEDRDAVRANVGYLPERPPLYDELTAVEQLTYYADLRGVPDAEVDDRVESWLDRFDLLEDADRRIQDYSTGMRQKVGLVQALLHDPPVLFLDEPTSGLDPNAARTMREVLTELADGGTTIFLSTHILPVVEELADTVGVLDDGTLVSEATPGELTSRAEAGTDWSLEDAFIDITTDREGEVTP